MAFAMREEWKAEPASTTGAVYVEPSAADPIKPGQRVAHLFPRSVMEEYVLVDEYVPGPAAVPDLSLADYLSDLERARAVDEAVPRITERLRPKYGRMYNFDDAQPGNVRLLAMGVQPSLANR